jgi:uncharacterized protein YkwD
MHLLRDLSLAAALLVILAGTQRAGPPAAPTGKARPQAATALVEAIQDLLDQGDERINEKDYIRANRLLEGGLRILRGVLVDRPGLRKQIDTALVEGAREEKGSVRTTLYRAVLVRAKRELMTAGRAEEKAVEQTEKADRTGFRLTKEEKTLLELTNKEREKEGLRPLAANAQLFEAARKHSGNMARQQRMAHTLDDKGPGERLREAGYRGFGWAENCAAGQRTPAEVVRTWMSSPGHRRNMLSESYGDIGLGVAVGEDGMRYWTQVFGTPGRK